MPLDQNVNKTRKNNEWRYILHFESENLKTHGGFINDMLRTWDEISQDAIRNTIDLQPKSMRVTLDAKGEPTSYMNSGFLNRGGVNETLRLHF